MAQSNVIGKAGAGALNEFQLALIASARARVPSLPACTVCGQSFGGLIDGAHAVCRALAARGLPTPMWRRCDACAGLGHLPKSQVGPVNPNDAAMRAWAPACVACEGKGYEGDVLVAAGASS